jgi:hypothetical protein
LNITENNRRVFADQTPYNAEQTIAPHNTPIKYEVSVFFYDTKEASQPKKSAVKKLLKSCAYNVKKHMILYKLLYGITYL